MGLTRIIAAVAALSISGGAARAASVTIDQSGQVFSERSISVSHGDRVVFSNRDDVTHNIDVIDDDDDATNLGLQKPGESLTYLFDKSGRFKVRCSIHPSMKMSIDVK